MSNKDAKNSHKLHPLLVHRWSPRAFSSQAVEKEKLQSLFEAARWSPSGGNQQPWRFIVGLKGDDTYAGIFETLAVGNQEWAFLAPVMVLTVGRSTLNGSDTKKNGNFRYDVGQSVSHLTFQAAEEGLYVHQMGGFDAGKAAEIFEIPFPYEPATVFVIGYLDEPSVLKDEKRIQQELAERERKPFDDFIFSGKFGEKSDIFI